MRISFFPQNAMKALNDLIASLGGAAYKNTGTASGTVAVGDDERFPLATCIVAELPAGQGVGKRGFVTDNSGSLTFSIGTIASGGGSDAVPVYFDGTDWRVG